MFSPLCRHEEMPAFSLCLHMEKKEMGQPTADYFLKQNEGGGDTTGVGTIKWQQPSVSH